MTINLVNFLLGTFLSYDFITLVIFPLLIATMYCDLNLIVKTTVIDCICVFLSMVVRYFIVLSDSVIKEYDNFYYQTSL